MRALLARQIDAKARPRPSSAENRPAIDPSEPILAVSPNFDRATDRRQPNHSTPNSDPQVRQTASVDPATVNAWWAKQPAFNVAVATGAAAGVFAVDVDGPEGEASLAALEQEHGPLPVTLEQKTGRGRHLFFAMPAEGDVRNSASQIGAGLDIRGSGGYVVVAPSIHPDGHQYRWAQGHSPADIRPATPPQWLLEAVQHKPPPAPAPRAEWRGTGNSAYVDAALEDEAAKVARAPEGQRNATLNVAAHSLGQLVGAGELDQGAVEAELTRAAVHAGLDAVETARTIRSGLAAGVQKPRAVPPSTTSSPSRNAVFASAEDWSEPRDLPSKMPTAPELPPELLPDALRPWIMDIADRVQVPPEFVAVPAMVSLSSLIGRSVGIRPKAKDDWIVVPNLRGMVIARPGFLKSPAATEALKPLGRLAMKAKEGFDDATAAAEANKDIIKARLSAVQEEAKAAVKDGKSLADIQTRLATLKREQADADIHERRYIINDGTVEKIGELLNQNTRGLLLARDELTGFLKTLDKPGREGDREFFLEAWNGNGRFTYDRIGRGTLHIPALTLSIIGTIQPGKLWGYISGALQGERADDGLLQRFQMAVWPDTRGEWRNVDRWPDSEAKDAAFDVYQKLDGLDVECMGVVEDDGDIPGLRFAPDAQELFTDWRGNLEARLRSSETESTPAFESHLAKYRSLMPSIALIDHLVTFVSSVSAPVVRLESARRAAVWCDYLEGHARKMYSAETNADVAAAHALADKIKSGAVEDGGNVRDLYRPQWSGLKTPEAVWGGLLVLQKDGWVKIEEQESRGRKADVVFLNPKLRKR